MLRLCKDCITVPKAHLLEDSASWLLLVYLTTGLCSDFTGHRSLCSRSMTTESSRSRTLNFFSCTCVILHDTSQNYSSTLFNCTFLYLYKFCNHIMYGIAKFPNFVNVSHLTSPSLPSYSYQR